MMIIYWNSNSFLDPSFFRPRRSIYQGPEAAPAGAEDADRSNIRDVLGRLENSEDAGFLKDLLMGWIDGQYPGMVNRLPDRSIGELMEGMAELAGVDQDRPSAKLVQDLIDKAFDYSYPNEKNSEAQAVLDRVSTTIKSAYSSGSDAQAKGAKLIQRAKENISSPRLIELREKHANLQIYCDKRLEVANRALFKMIKRELELRKLMEQYGFRYDPSEETENYYHFTEDHDLVYDPDAPEMTQEEWEGVVQATDSWRSMAEHFDRSNNEVERTEKEIGKVEAQIRDEENRLKKKK